MDKPTTAILCRVNSGLRYYEQALTEAGIKYFLVGRSGFWASPEIKAVLSYLGCVVYPADYLLTGAIRAPLFPSKFLPKTRLLQRLKELKDAEAEASYWKLLTGNPRGLIEDKNLPALTDFTHFVHNLVRYKDLPAPDSLKQVLVALKAVDYYGQEEETPDNSPLDNLAELVKISAKFRTVKEFMDYTRKVTAASKSKSGVALATCHAAKGLEFTNVFLVQCQEGVMPHAKSTNLQEESNVFFVGCSRAERKLVISYSGVPSPFLKETNAKSDV
jgi:DNA helicase-2/ATP-dependent DNA helicase PcrA